MIRKDLQQFLQQLESDLPDCFSRIRTPVDSQKFEITAALQLAADRGRNSVTLFEKPTAVNGEFGIPFVSNVFATRGLCAYALGLSHDNSGMGLVKAFGQLEQEAGTLEPTENPPCQEVVYAGREVNVWSLPIPMHHKKDIGPYLTMACVMKGYKESFYDITFTKNWVKAPQRMSISAARHHHLARIIADHEEQGEPTRMIVVLGHHPAFYLSACSLMPYMNNDYETAAAFLGEPLRLAPSVTWGGEFMVPADSEIVIEAEVVPGVRQTQNPFGEIAGYYQPEVEMPLAEVTAVSMKQRPVMQGIFPGHAEHWHLGGIPKEGSVYNSIRRKFPGVEAVHLPQSGCGRFSCVISLTKDSDGDPVRAAMLAFPEIENLKMVTVVDADVDVGNEREVQWAIVTRTRWDQDIVVIRNVQEVREWMGDAVVIIDATRPSIEGFPEMSSIPEEALAVAIEKGL